MSESMGRASKITVLLLLPAKRHGKGAPRWLINLLPESSLEQRKKPARAVDAYASKWNENMKIEQTAKNKPAALFDEPAA